MTDFPANPHQITGKHVSAILVAFFLVVIAANAVMLTFAVKSFGGLVVPNSYVASQTFNEDVSRAKAQPIRSWSIKMIDHAPLTLEITDAVGKPVTGTRLSVELSRPTKRKTTFITVMEEVWFGTYMAGELLDSGQWSAQITLPDGQSRTIKLLVPGLPE